jgi:hypothetical protein
VSPVLDLLLFAFRAGRRSRGRGLGIGGGDDLNFGDGPYAVLFALAFVAIMVVVLVIRVCQEYKPSGPTGQQAKRDRYVRDEARRESESHRALIEQASRQKRRDTARQKREEMERRWAERDEAYRERGIEPGPLAWFRALPDVAQAVLMGLAFTAPPLGLVCWLFA